MTKKNDDKPAANWPRAAKVGAAVGSAALVAALLYAGRRSLTQKKGKLEPQSPPADRLLASSSSNKAATMLKNKSVKIKNKITKPKTIKQP